MKKSPEPPVHLSPEAKSWWKLLTKSRDMEHREIFILQSAMECFDRMREAQAIIKRDGITIEDRFGQIKQHPATLVERDAKNGLLRNLKAIHLDPTMSEDDGIEHRYFDKDCSGDTPVPTE